MRYSGSCEIENDQNECSGVAKFIDTGSFGCASDDFQNTDNDVVLLWFEQAEATGNCSLYQKVNNTLIEKILDFKLNLCQSRRQMLKKQVLLLWCSC